MPCYHPLLAYREIRPNPGTGKRGITFNPNLGYVDLPIKLSCGQCIGCRLRKSYQWATRCHHEAQMNEENTFITLTFDEKHIDPNFSLQLTDFQKFMKRFRKKIAPKRIRFFHCGEYGDKNKRPHHHACIFGHQFTDLKTHTISNGFPIYTSKQLQELWPYGHSYIGEVTFESAAYVARYIMKKITGLAAKEHYNNRKPEYNTMSRRPGIGSTWFAKYHSDVYPHDYVVHRGKKYKPPKYYDKLLEKINEKELDTVKLKRVQQAIDAETDDNNSLTRLLVREKVKQAQLTQLPRNL